MTAANFLKVLQGDAEGMKGVGTGKVIARYYIFRLFYMVIARYISFGLFGFKSSSYSPQSHELEAQAKINLALNL